MRHLRRRLAVAVVALLGPGLVAAPADAAQSWQRYVVAPDSRDVRPVRVVETTGDVTHPQGVLGHGTAVLRRSPAPAKPAWPAGTTATASSFHAPNNGNDGKPRTYAPGNAIDGDTGTFWNDDTLAAYPDTLTITTPATDLPGITLQSSSDGVPQDFTVETWDGAAWHTAATVTGNTRTQLAVPFDKPATTTQVRLTVTKDQATDKGEFTRVNEIWPGLVADPPVPSVVVDFGKVVVGYPRISFAGASANNPGVRLAFSESRQYLTDRSDFTRSDFSGGPGTDQHAVPSGRSQWTDTKGCLPDGKVCSDGLHGFRYVRISLDALPGDAPDAQPYGEVRIDGVSLLFSAFLGTPDTYTGWFESSDPQLNQYWYGAAYTNELVTDTFRATDAEPRNAASPTLEGKLVLHDGAKRDRDPYVGDVGVSGRTTYLTHDTAVAARNVLADLADHQRADGWIPPASINDYTLPLFDYPLWWVTSSWDYVLYTGDTAYGAQYYGALTKTLDGWYPSVTDSRGLLSRPSGYGDYAFLPRDGEVTYYNALYVQALSDAAQLAKALGRQADADRWQQRAQAVSTAINTYLWDPAAGAYLDAANGPVRHGQDGNSIAVVAGVADQARAQSALDYLATHTALPYGNAFMDNDTLIGEGSKRVYAFTSYPELQAQFRTGQADSAIDQIKRTYGWMAGHDPGVTDWKGIGPDGSLYEGAYTSAAHGWSTGVLPALTNDLLGVTPVTPGFATWSVEPHPGSVAWARGQVPTPHGPLTVSWRQTGRGLSLTVTAPKDTSGTVVVNGKRFTVRGGTHSFTVR
ncbi:alpha-L-rhamnosidase C-terminal domain-containing protein [Amycolatopsis sacchari]|uniref:alpha-L-rhamnosidase-related protein n=1 Tax=Amycolatopsis sacchari TaxID=115433 RepID=UPI003D7147DA